MTSVAQVLGLARSQIGYHESPAYSNNTKYGAWYGLNYQPWCFIYCSWVFWHAGHPLPNMGSSRGGSYTPTGVAWGKAHGYWDSDGHYRPGDLIFFTWGGRGGLAQHVGIVASDNGRTVQTIEGNVGAYGGQVQARLRPHNRTVLGVVQTSRMLSGAVTPVPKPKPVSPPSVPHDNGNYGHPTIARGSKRGQQVRHMQTILVKGWRSSVSIDGVFGPQTEAALKAFQRYKHLIVDGVCGPNSWAHLHNGRSF